MKGLELQETSCNTVEATRVDDVFQDVLVHEGKWPLVSFNQLQHAGNAGSPSTRLIVTQHLLRRQKLADWGSTSTGCERIQKIASRLSGGFY